MTFTDYCNFHVLIASFISYNIFCFIFCFISCSLHLFVCNLHLRSSVSFGKLFEGGGIVAWRGKGGGGGGGGGGGRA